MRVQDIDYSTLQFRGWLEQDYVYELYNDDGLTKDVTLDSIQKIPCPQNVP